jgi:DNA-binding response OmpR family regulator
MGDERFDLILLDIMMPGLDGAKFLTILRKSIKGGMTPVVIVTALDKEVARDRIGASFVEDIVVKKADRMLQELVQRVRALVGSPGRSGSGTGGGSLMS